MFTSFLLTVLLTTTTPDVVPSRLNVLFIGDRGHHQPETRLDLVYGPLVRAGFAIDWEDDLAHVTRESLRDYDCVMMYANQPEHRVVPPLFMSALRDYVKEGGGFVALHCTSGCFMESDEWLQFVGARFVSHGAEVFQQEVRVPDHPVTQGWENFESWDETYVQTHQPDERVVLAMRGEEPWTWVREEGEGRVFYTASGHDARTWEQPAFFDLLVRALDWCAGAEAAEQRQAYRAPQFEYTDHAWVPNYEARDPHPPMQVPSTPEQARDALVVPAGFQAEVFASEPMVVNPIAITWDERGRCWVVESPDYPNTVDENNVGKDRISILEDTDGDGRADHKTIFKEGLNLATSLLKVEGGLIVTHAPDLVFLRDTNGDDHCDETEVLFSGFGRWDTHAGPSSLRWGPDNAIWGAVGYSSFDDKKGERFGAGLWRWRQGEEAPEHLAQFTNNTWGLGLRSDGEVFGSTANGAPSFFVGTPKPDLKATDPGAPGAVPAFNTNRFHPALEEIRQGDYFGKYTAGAGHSFATGSQMPSGWNERAAFVCGPTGHLVGRLDSYADGSGWLTKDAFNVCASLDDWFCPVQADVGPDGALWIADFAQFIILHNLPGNPERGLPKVEYGDGNAHLNPLRDVAHGRIFRIFRTDADDAGFDLDSASTSELVHALSHPNRFWRVTARRMIVEGDHQDAVPSLIDLAESEGETPDHAAAAAVRTLAGLGALENDDGMSCLRGLLSSGNVMRQKATLGVLPRTDAGADLLVTSGLLESPSADLRRHALLAASRMPSSDALGVSLASRVVVEDAEDPWLSRALAAAVAAHARPFLAAATPLLAPETNDESANLFTNPGFEEGDSDQPDAPLGWKVRVYGGEADHAWEEGVGRDGSHALAIRSEKGADTSWFTDVEVEPQTRYRLSAWIRSHELTHPGDTHGALLNIHPSHQVTEYVQDDSDWTRVALEFQTGANERQVSINCLYGGWGKSTGEAIYDDLELVSLGPANDLRGYVELAERFAGASGPVSALEIDRASFLVGGDPEAGRMVFFENQVVACNRCHAFEGKGGGVGPELTDVADRLSQDQLLDSILDPNAVLAESWTAPVSAMPALHSFLKDEELRDLIAFLASPPASPALVSVNLGVSSTADTPAEVLLIGGISIFLLLLIAGVVLFLSRRGSS